MSLALKLSHSYRLSSGATHMPGVAGSSPASATTFNAGLEYPAVRILTRTAPRTFELVVNLEAARVRSGPKPPLAAGGTMAAAIESGPGSDADEDLYFL